MPLLLGIVDLIGGRGCRQTLCIDDPLAQFCRMRDEVLKLVTERLIAEARCGLGQSKLHERFAERLLYDCQRGTLSRHPTPHPGDLLQAELTTCSIDDMPSPSWTSEISKCKCKTSSPSMTFTRHKCRTVRNTFSDE
jgi:hypothetical protein